MTGNDAVVAIDQDRIRPAVLDDAGCDLGNLRLGMRARIAGVGNQRLKFAVLDVQWIQNVVLQKQNPPDVTAGRVE